MMVKTLKIKIKTKRNNDHTNNGKQEQNKKDVEQQKYSSEIKISRPQYLEIQIYKLVLSINGKI